MIDTDKYEGHTEEPWAWDDTILTNHEAGVDIIDICGTMSVTHEPNLQLVADAPLLLQEVKRLREALITVQQSLVWDEKDRAMDGDPITLEAFVAQVEQVRSDITEMIE